MSHNLRRRSTNQSLYSLCDASHLSVSLQPEHVDKPKHSDIVECHRN